uniref:Pentatricopeptide repeat-containing protein n=2 Tax=Nymphaea colorata TaxID=210225 RepID=A0A5K0VX68_9MAGN
MASFSRARDFGGLFDLFTRTRRSPGARPSACFDFITLSILLTACRRSVSLLDAGPQVHAFAIVSGFDSDVTVCNCLMNMYAGAQLFEEFQRVFKAMPSRDLVSWNTAISVYARNERSDEALRLSLEMRRLDFVFDKVTFTSVLTACSDLQALRFGRQIHALVVLFGLELDVFVRNSLITLYARCDSIDESRDIFDQMVDRDIVSWNAMVSGYAQQDHCSGEAINVFLEMVNHGDDVGLDDISFASVLSACSHEQALELGLQCHASIIKRGCHDFVNVCNSLMSLYAKCDMMEEVNRVFYCMANPNVVSWTCMITLHEAKGFGLFRDMRLADTQPNQVTFVGLINACSSDQETRMVHGLVVSTGFFLDVNVANSLITMYAKFKDMEASVRVFEQMNYREVVSWNALIAGCAQNELYHEALEWFSLMDEQPNQFTYGSLLSACTAFLSLGHGRQFHCGAIKHGLNFDMYVGSALVDMYAKCGSIDDAQQFFDEMPQRSVVSWTVMISGQAQHGNCYKVLQLFKRMEGEGVQPDPVAFLALFSACGRAGLVEEGRRYFELMKKEYGIDATREHLSSMVDMLGRAGRVAEAEEFIRKMALEKSITAWQSLLGACRKYGNMEVGRRAGTALMELDPGDSATYVLLSNIYAADERWEEVARVRKVMRAKGVKKEVACSWVDTKDHTHKFTTDDMSHPRAEEIVELVENLSLEMRYLEIGETATKIFPDVFL